MPQDDGPVSDDEQPEEVVREPEQQPEVDDPGERTARQQGYLLDRLLYKGVLPRYAFPTDVATFYVFDSVNSTSYRTEYRFSPSQGLAVALSQYAPAKDVWIAGVRFRSGALYSPFRGERKHAWEAKRLYYQCAKCDHGETQPYTGDLRGTTSDCTRCGAADQFGPAKTWIRPPGFAHPVDVDEETTPSDVPPPSRPTRARLTAPSPPTEGGSWVRVSDQLRATGEREWLLVTNSGPEGEGYSYCTVCGRIEPTVGVPPSLLAAHAKPFPDQREPQCRGGKTATKVVLGLDFLTDLLLLSLDVRPPVRLTPESLATRIALRTVSEALVKAAATVLELEPGELEADFRAALTSDGTRGLSAEVYLYDTLPGGAGFSRQTADRIAEVLQVALALLESCECDTSCYDCLRSFSNKYEHSQLDRRMGASLLRYVLRAEVPSLPEPRVTDATEMLVSDLQRQLRNTHRITKAAEITVPGLGDITVPILIEALEGNQRLVLCVGHPLTPGAAPTEELKDLAELTDTEVRIVSELLVRRALPHTISQILGTLDGLGSEGFE